MIVDAVDSQGRRYTEVPEFPEGKLKETFRGFTPDNCVECNAPIRHGFERYFQRNNPEDGLSKELMAILLGMTYDAVCGSCGDRILRKDSL